MELPATDYVDIELARPIRVDGVSVKVLRMREPTVGDQLAMDVVKGGDAAKELAMMSNLCQITPDQLQTLTLRDYKKVQAAFVNFTS